MKLSCSYSKQYSIVGKCNLILVIQYRHPSELCLKNARVKGIAYGTAPYCAIILTPPPRIALFISHLKHDYNLLRVNI